MLTAETTAGRVRGAAVGPVRVFRGIPFAHAERFASPEPPAPWPGIRDAIEFGPAAPQSASRLARVFGPFEVPQDEHCLSLNVWAPAGERHPVLVFLHGGGFASGAGRLGWYDGTEFAAATDTVVVTVNYRLGALGYLALPGVSAGNLGLLDQLAALRWVRDNIAAFGGDPALVTVSGQSGGALSILAMLAGRSGSGLFRRAILQSTPLGMPPADPDDALTVGRMLLAELGIADEQRLRRVPVAALLAAQDAVAARWSGATPPFQLVADGDLVPADLLTVPRTDVDVLAGTNRDEGAGFFAGEPAAIAAATARFFTDSLPRLSDSLAAGGAAPWRYRFDWCPPDSPFGACHGIELPFVLGDAAAWAAAPMLCGQRPGELVYEMRSRWAGFVRAGDPGWRRGTEYRFDG
ncbi:MULTISPECIES: carboxylesterase/lipase family protein [unclassified Nocardia]|uniref:carboxylesterase/lipase family protein n=1 Tax=unclassified Nocardia TaxID=2637762 RepID=UPI001CE47D88|nr:MULTISPECIES: carboxylesterase family protein [unclassified Nocardia]